MMGVLLFNSGITVSVMAVVRYIHIKFPFYHVRKRWIVLFILFNMYYSLAVWMYNTFRAPASRRGNSLGIEAWILKIRALLNPRLEAQCG